jgi:hypothetical protein
VFFYNENKYLPVWVAHVFRMEDSCDNVYFLVKHAPYDRFLACLWRRQSGRTSAGFVTYVYAVSSVKGTEHCSITT